MTPLTPPASSPPAPESPTLGGCAGLHPPRTKFRGSHPELTTPRERNTTSSIRSTKVTRSIDTFGDVFLSHPEYAPRRVLSSSELTRSLVDSLAAHQTPSLLVNSVSGGFFNQIRSTLLRKSLKYSYSGDTGTLLLQRMPESAIHAALAVFASRMRIDMEIGGFITEEEANLLQFTNMPWRLPPGRYESAPGRKKLKKRAASDKVPDMAYYLSEATFASVIWECGWSENYDDLVSDARQWLEKGEGRTKKVVIAKINIDRKVERRILEERRRELVEQEHARREEKRRGKQLHGQQVHQQDGDNEGAEEDEDQKMQDVNRDESESDIDPDDSFSSDSSLRSTASDHEALRTSAHHNSHLWQAPITCFLEIWAWCPSTGKAYKHGPTYDVYPTPSPVNPRISRADLLPHIVGDPAPYCPGSGVPDMAMEFELKLEKLKMFLEQGVRKQAFLVMARERHKVRGSGKGDTEDEWEVDE